VCRAPAGAASASPRAPNYWKREYLAYASGLLADLPPGGLRAPRCLGAEERPGEEAWLWLEALQEASPGPWPLTRYAQAARHAGRFNGAYLTGRPLPAVPWLSAGVAQAVAAPHGELLARLPEFAAHPLVRRQWPDAATAARVVRLWREREAFFGALARLPQTLCHLDLFRHNAFAVRSLGREPAAEVADATVAVDWASLGTAAVGEELAPLVFISPLVGDAAPERARELGEVAFEGYLKGLRDAGWAGEARLVRLGYTAGLIRYNTFALGLHAAIDPGFAPRIERGFGRPFEEVLDRIAAVERYTLDVTDEARVLLAAGA
jgi:hypothetical protein